MRKRYAFTLFAVLLSVSLVSAQNDYPYKLIESVQKRFEKIKDYSVDATIKVDVNFLKVPDAKARITFKQPDKLKLDSDGFALLPKQGLNFIPTKLLNSSYTAIYVRTDSIDNYQTGVVKVIPRSDSTGIILSTLWIDPANQVIRKIETTTKNTGTINIDLHYSDPSELPLPDQVIFKFNVSGIKMPVGIPVDPDASGDLSEMRSRTMTGTVTISYSNYKINSGISDAFFEKEEDE